MTETENNIKAEKPKISKLAVTSVICFVTTIACWFLATLADCEPLAIIACVFLLVTLISGLAALIKIKLSKGPLTGKWYAITGIVISVVIIYFFFILPIGRPRSTAYRMPCGTNLSQIGRAILIYAQDHNGEYPAANKWCDLLLSSGEITEKQLKCSSNKNKKIRCTYAVNPNCQPNSPPDTVLVFETEGGWNQFGGPELLTTKNHNRDGCNILYNDVHVSFTCTFENLNWGK